MRGVPFTGWGEEGTSGQPLLLLMLTLQTGQEGPLIPNVVREEGQEGHEGAPHTTGGQCFTSTDMSPWS